MGFIFPSLPFTSTETHPFNLRRSFECHTISTPFHLKPAKWRDPHTANNEYLPYRVIAKAIIRKDGPWCQQQDG